MPEPITPERLNEITVRTNAATPGPWRAYTDYEDPYVSAGDIVHTIDYLMDETHGVEQGFRDAQFIAHARTDMDDLVAEIARLQSDAERVRALHAAIPHAVSDRFREAHPWVPRLVCAACGEDEAVEWPCPTIAALDGDGQ